MDTATGKRKGKKGEGEKRSEVAAWEEGGGPPVSDGLAQLILWEEKDTETGSPRSPLPSGLRFSLESILVWGLFRRYPHIVRERANTTVLIGSRGDQRADKTHEGVIEQWRAVMGSGEQRRGVEGSGARAATGGEQWRRVEDGGESGPWRDLGGR